MAKQEHSKEAESRTPQEQEALVDRIISLYKKLSEEDKAFVSALIESELQSKESKS